MDINILDFEQIIIKQARHEYRNDRLGDIKTFSEITLVERYGKTISNEEKARVLMSILLYLCGNNNLKVCEWLVKHTPYVEQYK